jgi:carboxylate-amine ligase
MKDTIESAISSVKSRLPLGGRRPLKHSMLGLEAEFFIIDGSGGVSHSADRFLKSVPSAKKECARNLVELNSDPGRIITGAMGSLLDRTESLIAAMERSGHSLYPFGTYPGSFEPQMRTDRPYRVKGRILGEERFKIAGCKFPCHLSLR